MVFIKLFIDITTRRTELMTLPGIIPLTTLSRRGIQRSHLRTTSKRWLNNIRNYFDTRCKIWWSHSNHSPPLQQYSLDITDGNQALLVSHVKRLGPAGRPPPGPAMLIPEFCYLTGNSFLKSYFNGLKSDVFFHVIYFNTFPIKQEAGAGHKKGLMLF